MPVFIGARDASNFRYARRLPSDVSGPRWRRSVAVQADTRCSDYGAYVFPTRVRLRHADVEVLRRF